MGLFDRITNALTDGGFGDIVEIAGAGKALYDLFDGEEVPSAVRQAGRRTSEIAAALTDPTHPLFQRVAAEEEGLISRDFTRALREIGVQNRRQTARTGMGILTPERRDEALAGAFAKSLTDRKAAARRQAREYLGAALGANQAVAGTFAPMIAADQREQERQASGMQMLLDLFPSQPNTPSVNPLNPPNLSFGGLETARPPVSTYTTGR